jgi:hypothetical protein
MAEVRSSPRDQLGLAGPELSSGSGLRLRPRRPGRALLAALLVTGSVAVALTVFNRVGDRGTCQAR